MKRFALGGGGLAVAALCLWLAACSDSQAAHVAPAPDYVAIARGEVEVSGGLLPIYPRQAGVVSKLAVAPGQSVHRGEVLLRLDDEAARMAVAVAQAEVKQAQAETHVLAVRLPSLLRDRRRWSAAVKAGAAEQAEADKARDAVARLQAQLAVARASEALARQHLAQATERRRQLTVRAPMDAAVIDLYVQAGSRVAPEGDQPMLTLLPRRPLIVRAEVNEPFVHRLHVGMSASLTLDAQPEARSIPATLTRIGRVLRVASLGVDPASQQRRVVNCILSFKADPNLLIGQHVMVEFHE